MSEGRLIVVSNRLPVQLTGDARQGFAATLSDGGLVTALTPVLKKQSGIWIGWPGTDTRDSESLRTALDTACADQAYRMLPVALTASDVRQFYRGFSNQIIWPLFHDCSNLCNFQPSFWAGYKRANARFAAAVANAAQPDDCIWVHDYQLMHVAAELRRLGLHNELGFFNHIPFPTPDVFSRLPWREEIVRALTAFDLVGFQQPRDETHFGTCLESLGVARDFGGAGSMPRTGSFPISIDFDEFAETAAGERVRSRIRELEAEYPNRQIILGVDRLDYSKGLLEKLSGLRFALERFPELRGRITLVQYVVPSRSRLSEYRNLRLRIERVVGQINGTYSEPGWIPVHYYFQHLDREELCAHYRLADICLVTSIKDGMNLVAKEYCAAQVDRPGVLVLSEFTGAANELGAGALIVNPFDVIGVSDAIRQAFSMSEAERRVRMQELRRHIRRHDVQNWASRYLSALRLPQDRTLLERAAGDGSV